MTYIKEEHKGTLRIIKILEALSEKEEGYTFSELVREIGVSKSTLFPLIHTLKKNHYISCDELTGKYSLGIKIFELGCKYTSNIDYLEFIKNSMVDISCETGETCYFGILVEGDVFYLLEENSPQEIIMKASVGKKLPAYSTAIGKALLTKVDNIEELKSLYSNGLSKITQNTITSIEKLYKEIIEAKTNGYAIESEESTKDITCIAVPIYNKKSIVAGLSIATPVYRYNEEKFNKNKEVLFKYKEIIEKGIQNININFWN